MADKNKLQKILEEESVMNRPISPYRKFVCADCEWTIIYRQDIEIMFYPTDCKQCKSDKLRLHPINELEKMAHEFHRIFSKFM